MVGGGITKSNALFGRGIAYTWYIEFGSRRLPNDNRAYSRR